MTYQEIASIFNVSRQRIHQIIKDYKKLSYTKEINDLSMSTCHYCSSSAENIHHQDGNSRNNILENLVPLCRKCHIKAHKQMNVVRRKISYKCLICLNPTYSSRDILKRDLCSPCEVYAKKGLCRIEGYFKREDYCIVCNVKFTKTILRSMHRSKGRCKKCFFRWSGRRHLGDKRLYRWLFNYFSGIEQKYLIVR